MTAVTAAPWLAEGYAQAVAELVEHLGADPGTQVSVPLLRAAADPAFAFFSARVPARTDVTVTRHVVDATGTPFEVRWYLPDAARDREQTGAVVYVHGGGMVSGTLDGYDRIAARYAGESGTPLLTVDYRLAPEHPAPAGAEDVLVALAWLRDHAAELGVDPARVALMGDSGGGGVAASAALLARDRGVPAPSLLVLAYPMLDDRTTVPDPDLAPLATWTYEQNRVAWAAVTGGREPGDDGYVAPARARDLTGLPPTFVDTGDCDIFRDEVLAFTRRLRAAGVPTRLRFYRGVPHAFEVLAPDLPTSRRALEERYEVLRRL